MKTTFYVAFIVLFGFTLMCNKVSDEESATGPSGPDDQGYRTVSVGNISLKYRVENDSLRCTLSAQTTGWIAVGFNPSNQMKDANLIIGYVSSGSSSLRDEWGTQATTHQADVSLGGTDNVRLVRGQEIGGTTEIEFLIPLDSKDAYDRVLNEGQSYPALLARGNADNFTSYHASRGLTTITL